MRTTRIDLVGRPGYYATLEHPTTGDRGYSRVTILTPDRRMAASTTLPPTTATIGGRWPSACRSSST